ncbi:hypothetical protein BDZ89DRAFT_1130943 [Hymenopellis radicata]|nr:hypothetical protein BDZ89DRAFT_1130943 [Hymenopellis radicata]
MEPLHYYPETSSCYDDDFRRSDSVWSPPDASATASRLRSSVSYHPPSNDLGGTPYYSEGGPNVVCNAGRDLSLFARTLKEQDDNFYFTFPDARPANYQSMSVSSSVTFQYASPQETVDEPGARRDISSCDYHPSPTHYVVYTSQAPNACVACSALYRDADNPHPVSAQNTVVAPALETLSESRIASAPPVVPARHQTGDPMYTSNSRDASAHPNTHPDVLRRLAPSHPTDKKLELGGTCVVGEIELD